MKHIYLILIATFLVINSYSQEHTLTHDGLTRTYRLHIPVNYNADSLYPLVINMHGLGSNAFEQEIYSGFNFVSDTAAFIVAYPNGLNSTWNVSSSSGTDDVGFISALIDTLDLSYNIDFERVYATGMSMGGFMSYRLACELNDRIAAIASVTGLQAFYPCAPARPVPVAQFHGTADPIVPYTGVTRTINNWVNYNDCPGTPVVTDLPDIDTTDNSTVTKSYYGPCEESTEVILYTINGGEHTWPGATIIIGITNQDINASREIWAFFEKFTIQGSTFIDNEHSILDTEWQLYPNPVSDYATVELAEIPAERFGFRIYSMTGELLLERSSLETNRFLIDCRHIPAGFYISELSSENLRAFRKIIIK